MTQASSVLLSHLQEAAKDFCSAEIFASAPEHFAIGDPWLLASCVQKAIRRDELLLARRAAHHLLKLDPQRLWRRLLTIGLEDIGIGDIAVAAELVGLASVPQARRLFGGNEAAL
ncbi:MAG TPA: hypothetical protein VJ476_07475, partial [Rhizomicrobium sp.]|nr:hypothetical protein [Rhizomicrobium sp.]